MLATQMRYSRGPRLLRGRSDRRRSSELPSSYCPEWSAGMSPSLYVLGLRLATRTAGEPAVLQCTVRSESEWVLLNRIY
jgi:hypothetical protein